MKGGQGLAVWASVMVGDESKPVEVRCVEDRVLTVASVPLSVALIGVLGRIEHGCICCCPNNGNGVHRGGVERQSATCAPFRDRDRNWV